MTPAYRSSLARMREEATGSIANRPNKTGPRDIQRPPFNPAADAVHAMQSGYLKRHADAQRMARMGFTPGI
jgi:hypothetical protein